MQRAFRIIRASHRASAWSGEGAAKFGGRWNSVGHPAIYVADSLALASMEVLVHLEAPEILGAFRWAWIELPKRSIATIEPGALPRGWDSSQPPRSIAAFGDAFLANRRSVALRIPSAVIPGEWNYLLNPVHPEFATLKRGPFRRFAFDRRLA